MGAKAKAMKTLYTRGKVTINALRKAVSDGVITAEEFYEITHEEF